MTTTAVRISDDLIVDLLTVGNEIERPMYCSEGLPADTDVELKSVSLGPGYVELVFEVPDGVPVQQPIQSISYSYVDRAGNDDD